jgi:hypothetical protein
LPASPCLPSPLAHQYGRPISQLFPGKPVGIETSRDRLRARIKDYTGTATTSLSQIKDDAAAAAGKGLVAGAKLTAEMRERQRREARQEGWRSDAFDVDV